MKLTNATYYTHKNNETKNVGLCMQTMNLENTCNNVAETINVLRRCEKST